MSFLTRKIRIYIMCTLIAAFFIIAPLVLFYTAGFRYDFSRRKIIETGVLNIDALPTDSIVYLNNVKLNKKLPIYLPNRAQGTYHIKITKIGYKTWEKDITIESKKTTYIKNVILFKEALPIQILENYKKQITDMSPAPSGAYLLIISKEDNGGGIYEIDLFNTTNKMLNPILRAKLDEPPNVIWAPANDYALIKTKINKTIHEQIIDTNNPETAPGYSFPKDANTIASTNKYEITRKENDLTVSRIEDSEVKENKTLSTPNIKYNQQTGEWLAWSSWELWTIYPDGNAVLLNRTSDKMNFVVPIDKYGLLLLASENKITGFNPGYYVTHELFSNGKIESVGANITNRKIFFLGEVAGKRGVYELDY